MNQAWRPAFADGSPVFEPLRRYVPSLPADGWPQLADLQRLLDDAAVTNARGMPLRLVEQGPKARKWDDRYEARIYRRGELQVRGGSWHDLFNVLAWVAIPAAKAALNARHYGALERQHAAGDSNRGPVQDALTLLDEGGVAVACSDPALLSLLQAFAWKELFWRRRQDVQRHMRFLVVGHALYEKLLEPYPGITGRGILFSVGSDFHDLAAATQVALLDAWLAAHIADPLRLASTLELAPVPVLGIPGWCRESAQESYYEDTAYFRPGRGSSQSPL